MDRFAVAMLGLDLLDQTRIRLACSLLLAEKMSISFVEENEDPDLCIFGLDSSEGMDKWKKNKVKSQSVILVSRHYQGGAPWLPHGTTVNEFRKFIHQAILSKRDGRNSHHGDETAYPLLLHEILNPSLATVKLFRLRSIECLIDTKNRCVYLAKNVEIIDFIGILRATGWVAVPLNESDLDPLGIMFPRCVSFESLLFGLSGAECLHISKLNSDQYVKLKLWPELIPETISSAQLLAIARLHARSWKPQNLAEASNLSLTTTLGLLSAALECGLLVVDKNPPDEQSASPVPQNTGFLVWVARRFGLRTSKE